jgi:mannose-6-phosphate isomerase
MRELLFMEPYTRQVLWGGNKLHDVYGYKTEGEHTGEAWVVSATGNGQSIVSDGAFKGKSLGELWKNHRELFGDNTDREFPLLVKLIDAKEDLSIQVHPDDAYAFRYENRERGKTECWYIVDCEPDSDIIIGHTAKSKEELQQMIQANKWNELLSVYKIKKGDFFFIPAGTVHAIRKGTLILETQQNCDLTYRLYDYGRLQNGKPRELHLKKSVDVITCPQKYKSTVKPPILYDDYSEQSLVTCPFFSVDKYKIGGKMKIKNSANFLIVNVLEGNGSIDDHKLKAGDNFIIPANYGETEIVGDLLLITSHI